MRQSPLSTAIPAISELTQRAARLLQQSLAQAAQSGNGATLSATDLELARSNIKAFAFVEGVGLHGVYRYLRDFIARQAVPIYSADKFLDGWLATYGLPRKEAASSTGAAAGTGVTDKVLPAGTLLQRADGRQYRTTADATVAGGVLTIAVLATLEGLAGDVAAGQALTLISPVVGIDSGFVVGGDGLSGGADVEKDEEAVYRLQQRLSNEPRGGSPADYARWALVVPGITRAWGVRNPAGPTSAGVIIAADGNAGLGVPTSGQRRVVFDYIRDPRRGPPDELHVIPFRPKVHDYVIRLLPGSTATEAGVRAALKDLYFREPTPGASMPMSHVSEVISGVAGEKNHAVMSPVLTPGGVFTVETFDELLCLGNMDFVA